MTHFKIHIVKKIKQNKIKYKNFIKKYNKIISIVNNMKFLKEQFKQIEKSYLKPRIRSGSYAIEKNQNSNINQTYNYNYKNDLYSHHQSHNLQGSFNSINNKNNILSATTGSSFHNYLLKENINDPLYEEFTNIKMLWKDLGVTDNYQIIFENLSKDIDPIMKQDLFELENNSLRKFSELLIVNK
jgi:hypothetical protein